MKQIIMESPFAADREKNLEFAKNVARSLVLEGYNPFASHLYYTQFLDDTIKEERNLGMELGFQWHQLCPVVFFCIRDNRDFEDSAGMQTALKRYRMLGKVTVLRRYTQEGVFISEEEI